MALALLTMSRQEIDRAEWMLRIRERRATQAQVAELRISRHRDHQDRRIVITGIAAS